MAGTKKGKKSIEKNKNVSKKGKALKIIKRIFLCLFLLIILAGLYFGIKYGKVILKYKHEADRMVSEAGSDVFKNTLTSIIYDKDGNIIAKLSGSKSSYYLKYDDIPKEVVEAFIVTEDRKFYEHHGVDYTAVVRAVVAYVENEGEITQGGSTITQQLARNIYLSHEVSVERKIKEMFIARKLESIYSKEQILEFYINNIYFGNGYYGIEAASQGYFGKSVNELTLSEQMFICAIPNNPTMYNPLTNIDNTIARRDRILKQLLEMSRINQAQYIEATNQDITISHTTEKVYNYEETFIRYCATIELMRANGFEFKYSFKNEEEKQEYDEKYDEYYSSFNRTLFTGGYQIYTSIDLEMQKNLQNSIDNTLSQYESTNNEGVYSFQGSATCIDNASSYVVAIVGGRSQDFPGYTLNRAYQSHRQPGSSIKPLLVYTPAFDMGYKPDTQVVDEKFEGGPKNAGNYYVGKTSVRYAVERSLNTVAWKLLEEMGTSDNLSYLTEMGFGKIVSKDYLSPAVAIGGFTYGVSTYEMAAGFATIENDGIYRNPTCIVKITDSKGNTIVDNTDNTKNQRKIYQINSSRMMTDVLKGVLTEGTGVRYNINNAICAGKTGTTNDTKDVWFVGYSKYYTTAVWCGYDIPMAIDEEYGRHCAGLIWQNYMQKIHEGLPLVDFEKYYDVPSVYPDYEPAPETDNIDFQDEENTIPWEQIDESTMSQDDIIHEMEENTIIQENTDEDTEENIGGDASTGESNDTTQNQTQPPNQWEEYTTVFEDEMYTESW